MNLVDATNIAQRARAILAPFCTRIEIAGSIRRHKPSDVKDVELVCIPDPDCLMAFAAMVDRWEKVKGEPTGRYTQRRLPGGIMLDLFMATPENWGCIYLIRTGGKEFSAAVMRHAREIGFRFDGGQLLDAAGRVVPTPEEDDVFRALGLCWVHPCWRGSGRIWTSR